MAYVSSVERIGMEKGMQAGMLAGEEKGRHAGEAAALHKLLIKRFGAVDPALAAQIAAANLAQIEVWFDRAIDAASVNAVFGDTPPPAH